MNKNIQKEAAVLVDEYNKAAAALSVVVSKLNFFKKRTFQENGQIIVSASGWKANALESIPMLRLHDGNFPEITKPGSFFESSQKSTEFYNSPNNSADFNEGTSLRHTNTDLSRYV
jgi:hypothetical protein